MTPFEKLWLADMVLAQVRAQIKGDSPEERRGEIEDFLLMSVITGAPADVATKLNSVANIVAAIINRL